MPYLKIVKRPHECFKPTSIFGRKGSRGVYVGTVWECPQCKKQWMIDMDNRNELYWRELKTKEYLPTGVKLL